MNLDLSFTFALAQSALIQNDSASGSMLSIVPNLLWFFLAVVALIILRKTLVKLADVLLWRLRIGSAIKLASFEIGQTIVPGQELISGAKVLYSGVRLDKGDRRYRQRESFYVPNRNLQLVHRVAPSKDSEYAYDVLIYIVPHVDTDATLASVKHVEYYCGRGWKNSIFTITDRSRGFPLALSTRGPFFCTAELHFTDDSKDDSQVVTIGRYIDGEMAGIARAVGAEQN